MGWGKEAPFQSGMTVREFENLTIVLLEVLTSELYPGLKFKCMVVNAQLLSLCGQILSAAIDRLRNCLHF